MHQLLLLRHAKSSWDDTDIADRARPLNRRGQRAAAAISRAMSELGLAPRLILSSPAERTRQTLAALAPFPADTRIETPEALYLADAEQLLRILRGLRDTVPSVLVVGHNPGLHELALTLAETRRQESTNTQRLAHSFPTAALAEFAISGKWRDLGPGTGRLVRFLLPRDLPEMAA
jgi:phosphohistidine phosphatase